MSKQEILSWTSLATSLSVLVFYILINFGWPGLIPDYSARFIKIFFNVFWIAVVIEIIVGISEGNKKIQKDERDFIIEAKGLKIGYNILVITLIIALVQVFISNFTHNFVPNLPFVMETGTIFHFLFIALFTASVGKRATMIYNYRKDY
ncbi:MAG: hypothetical protein MI700_11795 [Balneolales bacterium]|nr:hypothetical protein [Balneolales bacterium]